MPKRLGENRIIELATMIGFYDDDLEYLDKINEEAGVGPDGEYEKFKLSMGRYWLDGARRYLESLVDSWLVDDVEKTKKKFEDIPITVVGDHLTTTYTPDGEIKTTWVDKATGEVGEASILESDNKQIKLLPSATGDSLTLPPTPKSHSAGYSTKPWTPSYKDSDKIKATIHEILDDTPMDEWRRPGFQGWLAASATGALGGKTEPKMMIEKVREIIDARESVER